MGSIMIYGCCGHLPFSHEINMTSLNSQVKDKRLHCVAWNDQFHFCYHNMVYELFILYIDLIV